MMFKQWLKNPVSTIPGAMSYSLCSLFSFMLIYFVFVGFAGKMLFANLVAMVLMSIYYGIVQYLHEHRQFFKKPVVYGLSMGFFWALGIPSAYHTTEIFVVEGLKDPRRFIWWILGGLIVGAAYYVGQKKENRAPPNKS